MWGRRRERGASSSKEESLQQKWLEILAAVLLSLVGVATSWSGYQSTLWSGIQAASYTRAGALRVEASKFYTQGNLRTNLDAAIFMQWMNATILERKDLAQAYYDRFRPDFKTAFAVWMATDPWHNPKALPSPFAHAEYQIVDHKKAADFSAQADSMFEAGQSANQTADNYVLNTVILAMVMFFSAVAQQFPTPRVRVALLIMAGMMLIFSLGQVVLLPVAMN